MSQHRLSFFVIFYIILFTFFTNPLAILLESTIFVLLSTLNTGLWPFFFNFKTYSMSPNNESIHDAIGMSNLDYEKALQDIVESENSVSDFNFFLKNIQNKKECKRAAQQLENDQFQFSHTLMKARIKGNSLYSKHLGLIKIGLKDDPQLLPDNSNNIKRKLNIKEWIEESKNFYNQVLASPRLLAEFEKFDITHVELSNGAGLIHEIESLNSKIEQIAVYLKELANKRKSLIQEENQKISV